MKTAGHVPNLTAYFEHHIAFLRTAIKAVDNDGTNQNGAREYLATELATALARSAENQAALAAVAKN